MARASFVVLLIILAPLASPRRLDLGKARTILEAPEAVVKIRATAPAAEDAQALMAPEAAAAGEAAEAEELAVVEPAQAAVGEPAPVARLALPGMAGDVDTKSDCSSEASVSYVAGRSLELAGKLSVLNKKKAAKGDSAGWDGPFDEFEEALNAAIDTLQDLYDEVESMLAEPVPTSPSELPTGVGTRQVKVSSASGKSLIMPITPEQTVSELKSKIASELGVWPCQVVLLQDIVKLLDHEVLPSADSFTLVVRDIVAEAKAIAEELAHSIRMIKKKLKATPQFESAQFLYEFAQGPLLRATLMDADFGMWAARILDGLSWHELSGINFYHGIQKEKNKKGQEKPKPSSPPMMLLGHALAASDGGAAAAALFVSLSDGERWCAGTVGQALQGCKKAGPFHGEPGMGSSLASAFRRAIEEGSDDVARDVLVTCLAAAEIDADCAAPVALAGMARAAAVACKKRVDEPEVRLLAAALITSLLDALWPGRGNELKKNEAATEILVDDMVTSGLASYDEEGRAVIIAEAAGLLTKDAIRDRLGATDPHWTLQDLVEKFSWHSERALAWDS